MRLLSRTYGVKVSEQYLQPPTYIPSPQLHEQSREGEGDATPPHVIELNRRAMTGSHQPMHLFPPMGIRMLWAHPQRLLAGVAAHEVTWGPNEQWLMDEYSRNIAGVQSGHAFGNEANKH